MSSHIRPPLSLPPGSTVWYYLRDSGGPLQERSVGQQRSEILEYCQQHGLILSMEFSDIAKSGGSITGRDQFNEMIYLSQHIENRPDGILIWNYARFARDLDDSQYYKAMLRKQGIIIHSLTDPIPEGAYGQVIEVIIVITNQEKKRQTSRDAQRGLRELVEKHGCVPGIPPRGFMRKPIEIGMRRDKTPRIGHRWVPDPDWIPRIQKAFQMRASGHSLQEINQATRIFGSLNSYTTFWNNQLYRGTLIFGDLVIENYCEPIIDQIIWNTVQQISKKYASRTRMQGQDHPRRLHSNHLFSGLIKCQRCNSPLYGHTAPQRYGVNIESYRCTRARRRRDCHLPRIPSYAFEEGMIEKLQTVLQDPKYLIDVYRHAQSNQGKQIHEQDEKRNQLQKEFSTLRRRIDNITAAIAESGHSTALLSVLSQLEIQIQDLQLQIAEIKKLEEQPLENFTDAELAAQARYLAQELANKDPEVRKRVLRGFVHEVMVDRADKTMKCNLTIYVTGRRDEGRSIPDPPENRRLSGGRRYNRSNINHIKTVPIPNTPLGAQFCSIVIGK